MDRMECGYPGIKAEILAFEAAETPPCKFCASADTAKVQCGLVGRSMNIATATSKFKLLPNAPKDGKFYCNRCDKFFS